MFFVAPLFKRYGARNANLRQEEAGFPYVQLNKRQNALACATAIAHRVTIRKRVSA
jgi:hypothetical protein